MYSNIEVMYSLLFIFGSIIWCTLGNKFRQLTQIDNSNIPNLRCTATHEDISSISKTVAILSQHGVIGMYKKNWTAAHPCFFTGSKSALVPVGSLRGGQVYLMGKNDLFIQ